MNKKCHYLVIVLFAIFCFGCITLFKNHTTISVSRDDFSQDATNIQGKNYSIQEQQFSFDDVKISYPLLILDGSSFEEYINDLLFEILFCGENREKIASYDGVQYFNNYYHITFASEDIVSMIIHIDITQGIGRGAEYWSGITFSITEQKILSLSDICNIDELVYSMTTSNLFGGESLLTSEDQYDVNELLAEINWEGYDNYYLGTDFIGVILENKSASRLSNWIIHLPFAWRSKE